MEPKSPGNNGQDAMYHEAANAHGASLDRLARSYEADSDKRRDLLQDIHLALWRSFISFDGRCSLRTWVYRIAHNVATSHVIHNKRLTGKLTRLEDLENTLAAPDTGSADRHQTLDRLMALIRQLNLVDHAIIVLYLEGEDAASIAAVTGLSATNIATKIHRIKNLLARNFRDGERHDR
jgi:RNA polymerase sigma-70 factor (ECF subfamily)